MKEPTRSQRRTAAAMLRLELHAGTVSIGGSGDVPAAASRVLGRLGSRFGPLIGVASVRALFSRSAQLAAPAATCLAHFTPPLDEDEAIDQGARLRDCLRGQPDAAATEASHALFAAFLGLLDTFIGNALTTKILQGLWPEMDGEDLEEKDQ